MRQKVFAVTRAVLIIAITVLVLIVFLIVNGVSNDNQNDGENSSSSDNDELKSKHIVTFLNDDKSILKEISVASGESPNSPGTPMMLQGYVFDGWDYDLASVTKDITVTPLREKISNEKNVLSVPNGYGVTGDIVTLPLSLCGNVDICCFEAKLTYDKDNLQFVEISNEDEDVTVNCDAKNNVIYLNYLSTNNTTGQIDLCDVSFKLIGKNTKQILVGVTVDLAAKYTITEAYENVDCEVRNGKIDLIGR